MTSFIGRKITLILATTLIGIAMLLTSACSAKDPTPATGETATSAAATQAPAPATGSTSTPAPATQTTPPSAAATSTPTPATQTPAPSTGSTSTPTAATQTPAPAAGATAAPTAAPTPMLTPVPTVADGPIAPELVGTQEWINSEALKIGDLRGQVVLIDFWTYTCVNCIRTLPFLKIWHSKYADDGLVIIGVHTPEFRFEHEIDNVRQAVSDYGIGWPVVQDNDFKTWNAFSNRYWPAKYLIDKDGVIRYQHFGEGAYDETEQMIRQLLTESGVNVAATEPLNASNQTVDSAFKNSIGAQITAELYGGYERGCGLSSLYSNSHVANTEYCRSKDMTATYTDPGDRDDHKLYLHGPWLAEKESLRHGAETTGYEDYMLLRFSAKSVNIVLTPEKAETFKVLVTLDGEYLNEFNKGEDVVIEEDGKSYLVVDKPRLYAVVEAPEYGTYDLKLSSNSTDFALFAFTFGVYDKGI